MLNFDSLSEREILAAAVPRGVILFRRNIEDEARLARLIGQLRELGVRQLFLDQEGGPVDRLRDLVAPTPSFRRMAGSTRNSPDVMSASNRSR